MEKEKKHDFYNEAIALYLKRDLEKLRKLIKAQKLSRVEAKLINARLFNLDGKFQESLDLLNTIKVDSYYLMGQKHLVTALVYGRQSMFQHSAVANQCALDCYKKLEDQEGIFQSAFNLCVDYSRLSLETLFEHYWNVANEYKVKFSQLASLARVKASYYSKVGNYHKALQVLDWLEDSPEFADLDNSETFENLRADILFRMKNYQDAGAIYKKLIKNKKSLIRPRVLYENAVVSALLKNSVLTTVHSSIESTSEYYFLWKSLLALQEGSPDTAYENWKKLMALNPDKYQNNFTFKEEGDLNNHFSQYYGLLKSKNRSFKYLKMGKTGNVYKLLKVLEESEIPLRKEILIERVWEVSYDPGLDARFYKLIERLKKQYALNIIMEKSTYRIA